LRSPNWKEVLMEISCVLGFFGISSYLDTVSLNYLSNTKPQLQENNSLSVRIKIWGELIGLWLKQPIFGYGPNKAFVYRTQLHPENEFVFYLWRYGIQGLLGFFAILTIPFLFLFKKIKDFSFMYFVLIIVAIVALMNNPLANPKISVLFAMILGFSVAVFFNFKSKNE
jgi:O-antigen ligase